MKEKRKNFRHHSVWGKKGFAKTPLVVAFVIIALTVGVAAILEIKSYKQSGSTPELNESEKDKSLNGSKELVLPRVTYNLSGKVQGISESAIALNAIVFRADANGEVIKTIQNRIVLVTPDTKITKLRFVPMVGSKDGNKQAPQEIVVTISEILVGNSVEVISSNDISGKERFTATHIRILP